MDAPDLTVRQAHFDAPRMVAFREDIGNVAGGGFSASLIGFQDDGYGCAGLELGCARDGHLEAIFVGEFGLRAVGFALEWWTDEARVGGWSLKAEGEERLFLVNLENGGPFASRFDGPD